MKATNGPSLLWQRAKREAADKGALLLQTPAVSMMVECGGRLLISMILSEARIFRTFSPFALGFVAASGPGAGGFCALVGASLGYLSGMGIMSGLHYVSTAILIYTAAFAFYDLPIYRHSWFMPACGGIMGGLTGFLAISEGGWNRTELIYLATETALIACSAWLYRVALDPWLDGGRRRDRPQNGLALLYAAGTMAMALGNFVLLGAVELGVTLCAGIVLLLCRQRGPEAVSAGVILGLILDLCQGTGCLYGAMLAFGGLLAGWVWNRGKLFAGTVFLLGCGLVLTWSGETVDQGVILLDMAAAVVLSLVVPEELLTGGRARDRPQTEPVQYLLPERPSYSGQRLRTRLESQADAFETLYEDMRRGLSPRPAPEERLEQVFDRAAEQVCQSCPRYAICWKQDYHETYQAFRKMLNAMKQRGYGKVSDAPVGFLSRCARAGELASAANVEYASLMHRRQLDARLRTSRTAVWRQYHLMSQLLRLAAQDTDADLRPDPERTTPALRFLRRHGMEGEIRMGRDRRGRFVIQLRGGDLSAVSNGSLLGDLSKNMGIAFAAGPLERDRASQRMTLVQEDRYQAAAGVAATSKDGQTVSGDGGSWFRDREGCLWVALCDGMGSGPGAAGQSRLALQLLEDFLKAGFPPETALSTLSNALALRGESELGFTTIDLLGIDLFSGACSSYKLGAAPTYVRQKGRIRKLKGDSLPAGLELGQESRPDVQTIRLELEDLAVLVSDGVSDGEEDGWIWQLIRDFQGGSPKELAAGILNASSSQRDDRTVIVLQLKERTVQPSGGRRKARQTKSGP